jgi:hypothetical protein
MSIFKDNIKTLYNNIISILSRGAGTSELSQEIDWIPADPEYRPFEPEKMVIHLEDGTELIGRMLLDKYGNETSILFDAVTVLAKGADDDWYEVDIQEGSWSKPIVH